MRLQITVVLLVVFCVSAFGQDTIFVGNPSVRIDSDGKTSTPHDLSAEGASKYACRITGKGKRYFWASRDNRELIRSNSGDYVYFISPEGTGYVKIFTGKSPGPGGFDYLEHFSSELKTLTYWGKRAPDSTTPLNK
jgi:hypothetical protein